MLREATPPVTGLFSLRNEVQGMTQPQETWARVSSLSLRPCWQMTFPSTQRTFAWLRQTGKLINVVKTWKQTKHGYNEEGNQHVFGIVMNTFGYTRQDWLHIECHVPSKGPVSFYVFAADSLLPTWQIWRKKPECTEDSVEWKGMMNKLKNARMSIMCPPNNGKLMTVV